MTVKLDRPIHTIKKVPVLGRPVHNVKCLFESDKHRKARKLKSKATKLGLAYLKAEKAERKAAQKVAV